MEDQQEHLLPVEYFHIVFTLPHELAAIALQNKRLVYGLLFKAASETLAQAAAKHLGVELGVLAVLHTWGQNLEHHPHVHCVVPGGGLALDGSRWISCRPDFLLPVRVLGRLFRGKFLAWLKALFVRGELRLNGSIDALNDPMKLKSYLEPLYRKEWIVYAKPPFGGPHRVLKYLARYTHRVAISNGRLVSMDEDAVTFRWKDYAHGSRRGVMTLQAVEFLRRFLLHTLPKRFVRIRTYGFLANRVRAERLARCRALLGAEHQAVQVEHSDEAKGSPPLACPKCGEGAMLCIDSFEVGAPVPNLPLLDSS